MKIQVLYFEGCPNHDRTLDLVRDVARELGVTAEVEVVKVGDNDAATAHRFLGSPTVRVAGHDIDPAARERADFALACRRYGTAGIPPRAMIARAIAGAAR